MTDINILLDVRKDGAAIPWRARRLLSLKLAHVHKRLKNPKYQKILDCGGYLEFRRYSDTLLRLDSAFFCRTRLCPMCSWRRSRKVFAHMSRIIDSLENDGYRYIFLTLTCKNIPSDELSPTISNLFNAYKALCLKTRFKSAIAGWARCLEVTYNWQSNEYHPHFHCILAVSEDYFDSDLYITQKEWTSLWQSSLKVDYTPIVDVRVFTESEKGKGKEIAEVAKYTVKSSNIFANLYGLTAYNYEQSILDEVKATTDKLTDEIVSTFEFALKGRRLLGYGGIFKTKHKELNLDDDVDKNLIRVGDAQVNLASTPFTKERYRWDIATRDYIQI